MALLQNLDQIQGWQVAFTHSVGGFEAMGFSKIQTNQLFCVSSQFASVIDCAEGTCVETDCDFDQRNHLAMSSVFPDETISLCSAWGGTQRLESGTGESVQIISTDETYAGKRVERHRVTFQYNGRSVLIHNAYGYDTCTFSPCGNYFAFAMDGGITVLKRDPGCVRRKKRDLLDWFNKRVNRKNGGDRMSAPGRNHHGTENKTSEHSGTPSV